MKQDIADTTLTYGQAMTIEQGKLQTLYSPSTLEQNAAAFIAEFAHIPSELDDSPRYVAPIPDCDLQQHLEDQLDTVNRLVRDENGLHIVACRWSDLSKDEQEAAKRNIFYPID